MCHWDQGKEYDVHDYRAVVEEVDLTRSESREETLLDDDKLESFFHGKKTEDFHR